MTSLTIEATPTHDITYNRGSRTHPHMTSLTTEDTPIPSIVRSFLVVVLVRKLKWK